MYSFNVCIYHSVERAKRQYKGKVGKLFHESNMRDAWKGLTMLTSQDQTKKEIPLVSEEGSTNRLNSFYAHFDKTDFSHEHNALKNKLSEIPCNYPSITIEENDIIEAFNKITTRKAPSPDKNLEHSYSRNACPAFCPSSISSSNYQPPSTNSQPSGKQAKFSQ